MKEVTMYECELCNETFRNLDEALECESRGKETPLAQAGDFVNYEVKVGGGFDSFHVPVRVGEVEDKGHYLVYHFEEYNEDTKEWEESSYVLSGIWGNEQFIALCTVKK